MRKKLLSIFLVLTMVLCLAPSVTFAEGGTGDNAGGASTNKTIMLGTSGISDYNMNTGNADTIYYGVYNSYNTNYNVPWYVISLDESNNMGFMLSKYSLGRMLFRYSEDWGYYNGSILQTLMNGLYEGNQSQDITSLFTIAEKEAINATKLEKGSMHSDASEITDAHLFPLSYQEASNLGEESSILQTKEIIDIDEVTGWWWLRSSLNNAAAHCVNGGGGITEADFLTSNGVRPAFNLNLNSVLLSSASGTSKSSAIVSGSAQIGTMTGSEWKLTLKDDRKTVKLTDNQVVTMAADGTITVPYTYTDTATTEGEKVNQISVMITDKAYTEDDASVMYYGALQGTLSVNGTGTFVLPSALQGQRLGTDYHVYILAEHTTNTNTTDYAGTPAEIKNVSIIGAAVTGIDTPTATQALDMSAVCATTGVSASAPTVTWTPTATTAGYNTAYTASVTLSPSTRYAFTNNATVTVNGNTPTSIVRNQNGTITVTYAFAATAKDKLLSITTPQAITASNGTAYETIVAGLPSQVNIVTEGNTVTTASVTWNTATPASGSYDPSKLEAQSITLNGTVTCPDTIDQNNVSLTTTITINISAAGTTGAPTCSPVARTYTENQSVVLTSATEGATIYYTTDGSDPSIDKEGKLIGTTKIYSEPISVTGEQGLSVSTIIKAYAAKEGMFDSTVSSFDYTINIPHVHGFDGAEWKYDTTNHWHECTVANCDKSAGYTTDSGEHTDTAVKDHKCDTCGKVLSTCADNDNDHLCDVCGEKLSDHTGGTATCNEKAICKVCLEPYGEKNPNNHANLKQFPAKTATAAEEGNKEYWYCDGCEKYYSDETAENEIKLKDIVIAKLAPLIIKGDGQTVTEGEKKTLEFTSNAAYADFIRVEVDGKTIDESNYTVESGSIVVTLNADYVATLSAGEHTLGIVSQSGTATAKFTVNEKVGETTTPTTTDNTKSPQTGDNSNIFLWLALLLASGGAVTATTIASKKRKYNR